MCALTHRRGVPIGVNCGLQARPIAEGTSRERFVWPCPRSRAIVWGFAGTVQATYTPSLGLDSAKSPTNGKVFASCEGSGSIYYE